VKLNKLTSQQSSNVDDAGIKACKVTSVVLDSTHKLFNELGGWNSIGTITFTFLDEDTKSLNISTKNVKDNIALPLNPNNKILPLLNELVYAIKLPTIPNGSDTTNTTWYYVNPINILNSPHQNSYVITDSGNVKFNGAGIPFRNSQSTQNTVKLGNIFKDVPSVHPLLPFEGDYIIESRHGTYIRLGGVYNAEFSPQWSSSSQSNYFIISGKTNSKTDNIHVIEDINNDDYTIAGFSSHKLNIVLPSINFGSYNLNVTNVERAPQQLYEVSTVTQFTDPGANIDNTNQAIEIISGTNPSENIIHNDPEIIESEPDVELYNETEGDFSSDDLVYVLSEETVIERGDMYTEVPDIIVNNTNIVPYKYLSLDQLNKILNNMALAARYIKFVNQTLTLYKINNNRRIAHFLAQCLIESANFTRMVEIGNKDYFTKYEKPGNRLGNIQPGDGYKFRGRGIIQITGRYNVTKLFTDFNIASNTNPDIIAQPPMNILSAGWYWNMRKLNSYADMNDIYTIRKKVQGNPNNRISDISAAYNKIIQILGNETT
jgi:putative chitinase